MSAEAPPASDWNERLTTLERRNHRLTGVVVLLALLALAQTAWHFMPAPDFVMARAFRVQDARGIPRAELALWGDGTPGFRINNHRGEARALWMLRGDGTLSLRMTDENFTTRVELLVAPEGVPMLRMFGPDGRNRTTLSVGPDGRARLSGVER